MTTPDSESTSVSVRTRPEGVKSREMRFHEKIVLITGTGGGQGRCAALRFAAEGAKVVGCDLDEQGAAATVDMVRAAAGTMTSMQPIDLGDSKAVTEWINGAAAEHGGIDVLYNNASATRFVRMAEMSDEDWHFTLRNELDLVFYACRAAWPHLVASGGGAIVNVASMQGINSIRLIPGGFAHAATKHGVIGMTRELASEGGPVGIRVNAVSPGLILTPATQPASELPGLFDQFREHQIIKRIGRPEDVVSAAMFLASEESSFITGENLVVDGGYTIV